MSVGNAGEQSREHSETCQKPPKTCCLNCLWPCWSSVWVRNLTGTTKLQESVFQNLVPKIQKWQVFRLHRYVFKSPVALLREVLVPYCQKSQNLRNAKPNGSVGSPGAPVVFLGAKHNWTSLCGGSCTQLSPNAGTNTAMSTSDGPCVYAWGVREIMEKFIIMEKYKNLKFSIFSNFESVTANFPPLNTKRLGL